MAKLPQELHVVNVNHVQPPLKCDFCESINPNGQSQYPKVGPEEEVHYMNNQKRQVNFPKPNITLLKIFLKGGEVITSKTMAGTLK